MQFLETLFYFVVTLGVLVFIHEFGHFIAAKLCGMRVDRFSIGFPPRAFGKQIGDTDYCVSWIPIGGYVKIAGMIDESFDTAFLDKPPEPWEFRAKPIWQRMIVISAGVVMNILLAVFIFWGIFYVQGKTVWETTEIGYVMEGSPAAKAGMMPGDSIVLLNGTPVTNWDQILDSYVESMGKDIAASVRRNGKEIQLVIPRSPAPESGQAPFGIMPANIEIVVSTVESGKPADKLGLKPSDILLSLNGTPIRFDQAVREIVQANAGKPLTVEWKRGDKLLSGTTTPTSDGKIGISYGARYSGPITRMKYSLFQAFPQGFSRIVSITSLTLQQLWQLVTGKTAFSQSFGGPIKIAQVATQSAELGFIAYLGFMALLSISLAILNVLPFPALDGGHLMYLLYEAIFGKEIPVKIRMGLQRAGIVLLLVFMAFVVYNDIVHF